MVVHPQYGYAFQDPFICGFQREKGQLRIGRNFGALQKDLSHEAAPVSPELSDLEFTN